LLRFYKAMNGNDMIAMFKNRLDDSLTKKNHQEHPKNESTILKQTKN